MKDKELEREKKKPVKLIKKIRNSKTLDPPPIQFLNSLL